MNTFWQDLRYGIRMLGKNPGFAAIAILTLALGIGANTALFSIVNGVLLNPLPYADPARLVSIYSRTADYPHSSISYPNFLDWQRDNRSFSSIACFRGDDFNLTGMGETERLKGDMVSADFFPLLGVRPVVGRNFTAQEDQLGAARMVMISQNLWKKKFASAENAIGQSLNLNDAVYTIVGVVPGSFHFEHNNFYTNADIYIPIGLWDEPLFRNRATGMGMNAVGRLKPSVTLEQADQNMTAVATHLGEVYPDVDKDSGVNLVSLKQDLVGDIQPFLLVLLAAVAFVLLIACANVANLLLARSTGRTREFAIRTALGANRARMIRQILTECLLLALAGGTLGLFIAAWGTSAAIRLLPDALPRATDVHLDARVLLFTLIASVLAGFLFGLIPAWKTSSTQVHETLKEGGRGGSGTRHRTQGVIVAVEMALALVLLTGAGLMIRTLSKLWDTSPGFDPSNVTSFSISSAQPFGNSPDAARAMFRQLQNSIASVPGVQAVSLKIGSSPMYGDSDLPFWLEGEPKPTSQSEMKVSLFYVTQPDYLKVMKIPLLRGRYLNDTDTGKSTFVAVIDEQFARKYFPNTDPIGKHINFAILDKSAVIVGIVGHVKQWGLDRDATATVQAQSYLALPQIPDALFTAFAHQIQGVVRTDGSMLGNIAPINRALQSVNGQFVLFDTETMSEVIGDSLASKRFAMVLLGIFAALATLLSCVGIYGVLSYIAGQRTHEIGVRMALGAGRTDVLRMMLGQAGSMALIGVGVGIVVALALMQLMSSFLFGVSAHDPLTFFAVASLLSGVALAACLIPARRATRVDPMVALRYE
jgi:predicted permease